MRGKEFVMDFIRTYFTVVTLISVAMLLMGTWFAPDMRFGYEVFSAPLLYGAVGTLPNIVMYSKNELTVKEMLIRKVLQFILIEAIVLFVAFYGADSFWQKPDIIASMAISIFLIYVIASVIDWVQNCINAKQMTEDLLKFQESVKE